MKKAKGENAVVAQSAGETSTSVDVKAEFRPAASSTPEQGVWSSGESVLPFVAPKSAGSLRPPTRRALL